MNTKEFIEHFSSESSNIEYIKMLDWNVSVVNEKEALTNKTDNIYYLPWVRKDFIYNWYNRAWNNDIIETNRFIIDLDLSKNNEDCFSESVSYEDIEKIWLELIENLKYENELFAEFSFVILSWKWLHIYYMWDFTEFTPEEYYMWVARIYSKWDELMWSPLWNCDPNCKNIARIIRLPWSLNQKNWKECKILFWEKKESRFFKNIKTLAKEQIEEEEKKSKEKLEKQIKRFQEDQKIKTLIYWNNFLNDKEKLDNLFKKINSVPAYIIAEKILPQFKFAKNNKNFHNLKKWYCWYYYIADKNLIANWWSKHFNWGDDNSCWSPALIIKNQLNYTWTEVIKWFRDNFKIN